VAFEHPHVIPDEAHGTAQEEWHPLRVIKNLLFYKSSEELYDALIKRSHLTTDIYSLLSTLKFDLYGNISAMTPVYLKDGENSWLFYHDQVNEERTSFYYPFTDAQIDSICDHMAGLATTLEKKYNMHLIFLPLPAKYTLHHDLVNDDPYNNLLPRLYKGLEERNVRFVNVLDAYRESDKLLYYRTDSHWNQEGIDLAYDLFLDHVRQDSLLSDIMNFEDAFHENK
jgi:hypothetical protein